MKSSRNSDQKEKLVYRDPVMRKIYLARLLELRRKGTNQEIEQFLAAIKKEPASTKITAQQFAINQRKREIDDLRVQHDEKIYMRDLLETKVLHFGFSVQLVAVLLKFNNVVTLGDLVSKKEGQLKNIKKKQMVEIVEYISVKGLNFGFDASRYSDAEINRLGDMIGV